MKAKLSILLAVSLAFNVFAVVGYLLPYVEPQHARSPEARAKMMAEKLSLDPQQQAIYEKLMLAHAKLREARSLRRDAFYAELLKEHPDEEELKAYLTSSSTDEHRLAMLALVQKFVGVLRPEQRDMFVQTIRNRHSSNPDTRRPSSD